MASSTSQDVNPLAWSHYKSLIRDFRRNLSGFSTSQQCRNPGDFAFRTFSALLRTRIYFLASHMGKENTLMYVDLDDSSPNTPVERLLPWIPLIEPSFQVYPSAVKMSKEEQLLSERKRSISWGITQYDMHMETGKFIFPAAGSIYTCTDNAGSSGSGPVYPNELRSQCPRGSRLNPSVCPSNPNLVAYVSQDHLWLTHAITGQEVRLSQPRLDHDAVSFGLPSYIMQEEFNRYMGFWWNPVVTDDQYSILFEEVDESEVDIVRLTPSTDGDEEEFRFPRPGTKNAKSNLKLVSFKLNSLGEEAICDIELKELKTPLQSAFPWLEYIVRLGWTPDGKFAWTQILNRRQHFIQLILIPSSAFVSDVKTQNYGNHLTNGSEAPLCNGNQYQVILQEQTDTWITVHNILEFFEVPPHLSNPGGFGNNHQKNLDFIWASEESGFRHLYLYTVQISSVSQDVLTENENSFRTRIIRKVALTSGQWTVIDKPIWVDKKRGLIYFQALKDSPLEKHLYVVSLNQPDHLKRLTIPGYSHSVQMNEDCSIFVSVYSSITTLPGCQTFRISHNDATVDGVVVTLAGHINECRAVGGNYKAPEIFEHTIFSGDKIYGMIFEPNNMEPNKKYPIVLHVYGGPEVQLITNNFKGIRMMRNHLLASQGYCVVCIDSRGSQNRGMAFEAHIKNRMGQVEMKDQVEVLTWLGRTHNYMDMERVAIHGWSYGGYLSLMGLLQFPDVFKVTIAGAPVVTWANYDTGYTERYMDLPHMNEDGYRQGSILNKVKEFPDQPNRVLIVHGLKDENVHFSNHTTLLLSELIRHGKPYQLQIYPDERHSLRQFEASEHYEITLLSFLKNNL